MIVTCMYRAPDTNVDNFTSELESLLARTKIGSKLFLLTGDFNLNLLNLKHVATNNYFNMLVSQGLTPTITLPTRVTEFSATLIDNIYINCLKYLLNSTIIADDTSDHFPILLELSRLEKNVDTYKCEMYRSYDNGSIDKFSHLVEMHSWSDFIYQCEKQTDSSLLYDLFLNDINKMYNVAFPLKVNGEKHFHKQSHPWLTKQLIKCCNRKSHFLKTYKQLSTPQSRAKFLSYRNILKNIIRCAVKNYYAVKFSENLDNAQKTWHLINEILAKPQKNILNSLTDSKGCLYSDSIAADMFNEYFANVGPDLSKKIPSTKTTFAHYIPIEAP